MKDDNVNGANIFIKAGYMVDDDNVFSELHDEFVKELTLEMDKQVIHTIIDSDLCIINTLDIMFFIDYHILYDVNISEKMWIIQRYIDGHIKKDDHGRYYYTD